MDIQESGYEIYPDSGEQYIEQYVQEEAAAPVEFESDLFSFKGEDWVLLALAFMVLMGVSIVVKAKYGRK